MERDKALQALSAEITERKRLETRLESEIEARKADLQSKAEKNITLGDFIEGREGVERLQKSELQDEIILLKVSKAYSSLPPL